METVQYCIRKLLYGIPLIIGVTLISFTLMVYFGPDKTYDLIGKNATKEKIAEIRHQLGYDKPFVIRYVDYLIEVFTFNFGHSDSNGEKVTSIFKRTIPISLALELPGFFLGHLIGIVLALWAAYHRGTIRDRLVMTGAVAGMSISFLIVVIGFQIIFCSSYGLNIFPVAGWEVYGFGDYLKYITVPTISMVFVAVGYDTRFYRAIFVEELTRDHVRTAKAFGAPPSIILFKSIVKNSMIPIITRIIFSLPFIIIAGSIIIESYFNIPGIGSVVFNAIISGDQPVLKAVVSVTAVMYVIIITIIDIIYRIFDPRISLK